MRALGRASASGGKGKKDRVKKATKNYLTKAKALMSKLESFVAQISKNDVLEALLMLGLKDYMKLLEKHIDLLERRVIIGEEIPHEEKMFSMFEDYTG